MHRLIHLARRVRLLTLAALIQIVMAGAAFAQQASDAPETKNPAIGYILTILAIALGLVVVCRPGRRGRRSKVT
jgi:hypothetical protein